MRETTYASYAWMVRVYLEPALGSKKLAKLQVADIRRAFSRLKEVCQCCALGKDQQRQERAQRMLAIQSARPPRKNARKIEGARCCALTPSRCCHSAISDGTIRYVHRVLRAALQDAVSEGILTNNVAKNLRLSQRYRPKFVPWTGVEARRFLRASEGDRLYALYAVALSLGLRRGEALGLRWSDVDLAAGVIRVRQALQRVNGRLSFGPVKTDGSVRAVAIPVACAAALGRHRERQHRDSLSAGSAWHEHGLVFTTTIGTPIEQHQPSL